MRRLSTQLIVAAALALAIAPALAQEPTGRFAGETTVNVIEVPVRVIDSATGRPVTDLGLADFRILEDGVEQPISNFSEIRSMVAVRPAEEPGADGQEPVAAAAKPLEIVYFFDLFLMYRGDRDRAVEGLEDQYRQGVPDGERVSLVAFDGELETLADRSRDRQEILDGLNAIRSIDANGIKQRISFTEALSESTPNNQRDVDFYEHQQRNTEFMYELERKTGQVGNAILATMARYGTADGRRVLVAMTPGYPKTDWSPTYNALDFLDASVEYPQEDLWRQISRQAADLGFTLYTVDTSGLSSSFPSDVTIGINDSVGQIVQDSLIQDSADSGASADFEDPSGPRGSTTGGTDLNDTSQNLGQWLERARKNLLITSAADTGGSAIFPANVNTAVGEIRHELDQYYSIGYVAQHSGDGGTYAIEVELPGHPGYRLIHRAAYIDQPAATRAAQALRSEMLFGADANPLGIRLEVGELDSRFRLGAAGSKRVRVPLEVKIPYARLAMVPRGDLYWGKIVVTFFGEDAKGNQSELASFEQPITVDSARYDEAVARGYFKYTATVEVEGGEQRVFVGVQDTLAGRTSIIPHDLEY
jgi:VWFA-related protein